MHTSIPLHYLLQKKTPAIFSLAAFICLCLSLGPASAAVVVNIDLNGNSTSTFSGQGAYSDPGNNLWNGLDLPGTFYTGSVSTDSLLSSTGGSSSIVLTLTSVKTQNIATLNATYATGNAMLDDYVYSDAQTTSTFLISGLSPGASYALYLYGDQGNVPGAGTTYIVGGVSQSVAGRALGSDPYTSYALGKDYTLYSSVAANGSGQIAGSFATEAGTFGFFDGLQIVAVPEPTTISLLSLGGLALLLRRKFRRRELAA